MSLLACGDVVVSPCWRLASLLPYWLPVCPLAYCCCSPPFQSGEERRARRDPFEEDCSKTLIKHYLHFIYALGHVITIFVAVLSCLLILRDCVNLMRPDFREVRSPLRITALTEVLSFNICQVAVPGFVCLCRVQTCKSVDFESIKHRH